MMFQTSEFKRNKFLNLLNKEYLPIKPIYTIYTKEGAWFKLFSYSNLLYTKATRAITNHALIGEYCLRFFPKESFNCSCSLYPIESR